jgi:hypothetical protein
MEIMMNDIVDKLDKNYGGFNGFVSECEYLKKDLESNPYNACGDHERVELLIEIAKQWYLNMK